MASIHTELRPTGALLADRRALTPDTPPLIDSSSRVVYRPAGSAEELDEIFPKTCFGVFLLTWVRGLVLV